VICPACPEVAGRAPAWIEFDGAAQAAQLRRTVTTNGKKTVEVVYLITSDPDADPATPAGWVRSHRHHARDPKRTLKLLQTA
jgi:hypothetical protein